MKNLNERMEKARARLLLLASGEKPFNKEWAFLLHLRKAMDQNIPVPANQRSAVEFLREVLKDQKMNEAARNVLKAAKEKRLNQIKKNRYTIVHRKRRGPWPRSK